MKITDIISRIFFPKKCPLCKRVLYTNEYACKVCTENQIRISNSFCHHCGYDSDRCICSADEISLSHLTAPYIYSGLVKKRIHQLKFYSDKAVGDALGDELAFRVAECFFEGNFDCVTFVPLSQRAQKERGYNQSELLARRIGERLFIPCVSLLEKNKETRKQHEISFHDRKTNLKDAFTLKNPSYVKDKTILLCDDVKTTGSTLKECERLLFENGARDVYCVCVALSDYGDIFL